MSNKPKLKGKQRPERPSIPHLEMKIGKKVVESLLDVMQDGSEYESIVGSVPKDLNLIDELTRALRDIEAIRGRPCLCYVGNVVRPHNEAGVDATDDLPFAEMVGKVNAAASGVDIFLVTNGGSAYQVSRFVNVLRGRFPSVEFLLPSFCMSAGTLFALSGDRLWMTSRACLGPIDPQVPSKDGRLVPAQALLLLVDQLQRQGQEALDNKIAVPWTVVRIIDSIDKKELGDAISASEYSRTMATQFLQNYKLRSWLTHKSNDSPVTDKERSEAAQEIADALASHLRWKAHGHAIAREVLWNEVKLLIDRPEAVPGLDRALTRFWALCNWIFDKTPVIKILLSSNYSYIKHKAVIQAAKEAQHGAT